MSWQNYWKHKGHIYGHCYTSDDSRFFYCNIPKNASSWTKDFVTKNLNWTEKNFINSGLIRDKIPIVVLRDPIERWLSGITEYINHYHENFDVNQVNTTMLDWIFDRVAFDDHTERQSMFIESINLNKTVWFWCDHTYSEKVSNFFHKEGLILTDCEINGIMNMSNGKKTHWSDYFRRCLVTNPEYNKKIQAYYQDDYKLIKSVKFFND